MKRNTIVLLGVAVFLVIAGLSCVSASVPRNSGWARMSDHLPLLVELQLD